MEAWVSNVDMTRIGQSEELDFGFILSFLFATINGATSQTARSTRGLVPIINSLGSVGISRFDFTIQGLIICIGILLLPVS